MNNVVLLLGIFIATLGLTQTSSGLTLGMSSEKILETQQLILLGTVDSVETRTGDTEYDITVLEYVKIPAEFNKADTLHVVGCGEGQIGGCITFDEGQDVLFILDERNNTLLVSELSFVSPNPNCTMDEIFRYNDEKYDGLSLYQGSKNNRYLYTNQPIIAQYYYFNKNLEATSVDVTIKVVDNFPDILKEETIRLDLEECQPKAKAEMEFVIDSPGSFAISAKIEDNGGGEAFSGVKVIDYVVPPLKQFKSGIPTDKIQCKEGLELILKPSDDSPACVSPETKQLLIERGWAKSEHLSRLVEPEHIPDPVCFVIEKVTSGEKGSAMSSDACFPLSDFESLGCDRSILEYIYKYTNLLEGEFDGNYVRNMVGLPEGVSEEEYEKCADSIYEKRKSMSENMEFESFSIVEGTKIKLEGVIMDMRLGPNHQYSFFTNDSRYTFNTGSEGITLEGINNEDDLHGKIVTLSGIRTQRDLGIKVDDIVVTGSLIPSLNTTNPVLTVKDILDVSLDALYENPDQYYGRSVRIAGELSEYEDDIAYAGVGCYTATYTTSDEFVSDFPSSRHLHDGDKTIGVRIDTPDDLGQVTEPLPSELKASRVTIMGVFVPNVVERGDCDHVIHKSGFLLTKLDDINLDNG